MRSILTNQFQTFGNHHNRHHNCFCIGLGKRDFKYLANASPTKDFHTHRMAPLFFMNSSFLKRVLHQPDSVSIRKLRNQEAAFRSRLRPHLLSSTLNESELAPSLHHSSKRADKHGTKTPGSTVLLRVAAQQFHIQHNQDQGPSKLPTFTTNRPGFKGPKTRKMYRCWRNGEELEPQDLNPLKESASRPRQRRSKPGSFLNRMKSRTRSARKRLAEQKEALNKRIVLYEPKMPKSHEAKTAKTARPATQPRPNDSPVTTTRSAK